jgi:FixJ family two-component response regulator
VPIFFLSGDSKSQQIIDALKLGAHEFLLKPVTPNVLSGLLNKVFLQQEAFQEKSKELLQNQARLALLTKYEHQSFRYIVQGFSNKKIAGLLGLKADTIKKRRAQIYLKLEVADLPELINKYGKLDD